MIAVDERIDALSADEWRAWVVEDHASAEHALRSLGSSNNARFLYVCRKLAEDGDARVAEAGLRRLGFQGTVNDAEADRIARHKLEHGDVALRDAALLALGRVGTPSAFKFLESYLTPDSHVALLAFAGQARGAEQRAHVVEVTRKLLFSPRGQVRIASVRILRGFSSVTTEQELLVKAAKEYLDETTFAALRHADSRALPELRELQARLRPGTHEWMDLTTAIEAIEHNALSM